MLVFSLLAKTVEKLDQAKDNILENRFAQKGCSKTHMADRLMAMKLRAEELRRESDERQRKAEEAWKAKVGGRAQKEGA